MTTRNRNRQPKGTSKGGQFAPETHEAAPDDLDTGEQPSIVYYHPDGTIDSEQWRNKDGKLDRADGPAYAAYSPDGTIKREEYWQDGALHREDGPAVINYDEDGNVKSERWYLDNAPIDPIVNSMPRNVGEHPAGQNSNGTHRNVVEYYDRCVPKFEEWRNKAGQLHRAGGPAVTKYNPDGNIEYEEWWQHGGTHRTDGAAKIRYRPDGSIVDEVWCQNGLRHRIDGPAGMRYYEDGAPCLEEWWQDGKLHRDGAPAVIEYSPEGTIESEQWWQDGEEIAPPDTPKQ